MTTDLIKRLHEGDDSSFKEIYELYHFKVFVFVNGFTMQSADTEDITQNVFIHLWNYRNKIEPSTVLDAVLYKSARQEVFRWYRAQDKFPLLSDEELREDIDIHTGETEEEFAQKFARINTLLEQVPEKRRRIFALYKFEQRSYKEIAMEMDMTPGAVAKQVSKTLQFLKDNVASDYCLVWYIIIVKFLDL